MPHMLITGAGRGLGRALAEAARDAGWQVTGTVRHSGAAPDGIDERVLDVTDPGAMAGLATGLAPPDVLINNAGIIGPDRQSPLDMDFQGFAQVLAVNTLAPLAVAQAVLPGMKAGARILTISSQMAWMGYAKSDRIAYRASKAAVNKVMQGLATALEPEGIAVALVDPGWVRTAMGGPEAEEEPEAVAEGILTLAERLTLDGTGRFYRWNGEERDF